MSFRRSGVGDRSRASRRGRVALRSATACLLVLLAACAEPLSPAAPPAATPLGVDLGASSRVASLPGQAGEGEGYATAAPSAIAVPAVPQTAPAKVAPAVVDHGQMDHSQMDHSQMDHGAAPHPGGH